MPELIPAHARIRRVTISRLREVMKLNGSCENCGEPTKNVAFFNLPHTKRPSNPSGDAHYMEICNACLSSSNRRPGREQDPGH